MSERPIIFSAPMVRAILDGRKTQTRRVVNHQLPDGAMDVSVDNGHVGYVDPGDGEWYSGRARCPFGVPGDRLWVRETFSIVDASEEHRTEQIGVVPQARLGSGEAPYKGVQGFRSITWKAVYRADGELSGIGPGTGNAWASPLYMPKWAARIWLTVTDVRVQRLQDISEEDAIASGIRWWEDERDMIVKDFVLNWHRKYRSSNKRNGIEWMSNPWVWAVSFEVER